MTLLVEVELKTRGMRAADVIPGALLKKTGFDNLPLDPKWCWVATSDGEICGVLIGGNMHGIFYMLRIVTAPDSPVETAMLLLRKAMRDALSHGCIGALTYLDLSKENEKKLLRIGLRAGGSAAATSGVWLAGRADHMRKLGKGE